MASIDLDGRRIEIREGDTVASALFRAGVRTFSRSFKYHRARGLYCLSGDCPNCLVNVDGVPGVRACSTPATDGQRVRREHGWPSVERDLLSVLWRLDRLFPVGFYYKMLAHPRRAWPAAEPIVRRVAGLGRVDRAALPPHREARHLHPDVLVIGAGVAGLAAACAAAKRGEQVLIADEGEPAAKLPPGAARTRAEALLARLRARENAVLLERATAVGVYEGPLVPIVGPDLVSIVRPRRVVVATGAVEQHGVFAGNDLPGVWLGRGAVRMAAVHGIAPGRKAVVVGGSPETAAHAEALARAGLEVVAVERGHLLSAHGRRRLSSVRVQTAGGSERIRCDTLVLSLGLVPRDGLLRQADGIPAVVGAGDVVLPGCSPDLAAESGEKAALTPATGERAEDVLPEPASSGVLCLCEDVKVSALELAWQEGFRSTELLKRYATVTMGPCQGALCHGHLRSFVRARGGGTTAAATTSRPPVRPITLADAAAGVHIQIDQRTALHERHLAIGATMEWIGAWKRPERYGDLLAEYWAVRRGVSIMDVGTLGKLMIGGRDAREFLERMYPCTVSTIAPARVRYALLLNESGFIIDDGLICPLDDGRYYCTLSTGGAEQGEAWFRNWAQYWGRRVDIVNRTQALGAINVAGPRAREILAPLCDAPLDNEALPFMRQLEAVVAGVPCRIIRLGFVGELSYELHHPASRSEELWDALLAAGDVVPHGLEVLRLLRLEKGHILIGQDTEFDTTPAKVGLQALVGADKGDFVGKLEHDRLSAIPLDRKLVGLRFPGAAAPVEGAPLLVDGTIVGHVTSSRSSPVLEHGIALAWLRQHHGAFPGTVAAGGLSATVVNGPFYDPEGARLRA
jgi:sarcosine oxidase subunit alpha